MYGGSKHLWFGINVKSQLFSVQIRSTVWKEEVVTFVYNRAIMSFSAPRLTSVPGTSGCKNWSGKDTSSKRGKQQCFEQYLLLHSQLRGLDQLGKSHFGFHYSFEKLTVLHQGSSSKHPGPWSVHRQESYGEGKVRGKCSLLELNKWQTLNHDLLQLTCKYDELNLWLVWKWNWQASRRERELEAEATKVKKQEEKYKEELEEVNHDFLFTSIVPWNIVYTWHIVGRWSQVGAQVAEQRKQTVHKARPMPKYTRLEVHYIYSIPQPTDILNIYSIPQSTDILNIVGDDKPEEGDDCHLPKFAHQEEGKGVKMMSMF